MDFSNRLGQVSGYDFVDDYHVDNPYPGSVAGASIPGFDALYIGRAQLISLSDNKLIGANTVNELHLGYLRNANIIGQPKGGLGVSLPRKVLPPAPTESRESIYKLRSLKGWRILPFPPSSWEFQSPI